jgi:hypothetical protein
LLQITMTTRSRRITLQCSQRGLTDARTFTKELLKESMQDPLALWATYPGRFLDHTETRGGRFTYLSQLTVARRGSPAYLSGEGGSEAAPMDLSGCRE